MTSKTLRPVFLACCAFLIAAALSVRAQAQTPVSLKADFIIVDGTRGISHQDKFQRYRCLGLGPHRQGCSNKKSAAS
ncbi:MAG: hypothetical protein AAFW66_05960, partial [Pseudomonadota bacterium]